MRPARSDNHQFLQVSELIDNYTGTWNIDLVWHVFPTAEADAILNISLRSEGGEDVLAWAPEKSSLYSVKTAYRSLMTQVELRAREEGTVTHTPSSEQQMSARLWKLKVLPKVRKRGIHHSHPWRSGLFETRSGRKSDLLMGPIPEMDLVAAISDLIHSSDCGSKLDLSLDLLSAPEGISLSIDLESIWCYLCNGPASSYLNKPLKVSQAYSQASDIDELSQINEELH
ncbi:Subtilisin-like protease [Hordeum vulgare]|nr:Subtilisin-like protease [Hordeum vulgare]